MTAYKLCHFFCTTRYTCICMYILYTILCFIRVDQHVGHMVISYPDISLCSISFLQSNSTCDDFSDYCIATDSCQRDNVTGEINCNCTGGG